LLTRHPDASFLARYMGANCTQECFETGPSHHLFVDLKIRPPPPDLQVDHLVLVQKFPNKPHLAFFPAYIESHEARLAAPAFILNSDLVLADPEPYRSEKYAHKGDQQDHNIEPCNQRAQCREAQKERRESHYGWTRIAIVAKRGHRVSPSC